MFFLEVTYSRPNILNRWCFQFPTPGLISWIYGVFQGSNQTSTYSGLFITSPGWILLIRKFSHLQSLFQSLFSLCIYCTETKLDDEICSEWYSGHGIIRWECRSDEADCRRWMQSCEVWKTSSTINGPEARLAKGHLEAVQLVWYN